MKAWKKFGIFVLVAVFTVGLSKGVYAQQSESTNYGVDQAYFGSGAELEMNSNNYKASAGAGDSASGNVEGVQYSGNTGSPVSGEPLLEVNIIGSGTDHGVLNPAQTTFGSSEVHVRNYNGSGYIMQVTGMPPKQSVYTIPGLGTPTASQAGMEQFGINLVDNSTPNVGADPVQVPDSTFSYGVPAPDYATANLYKYVSGDIVAQSTQESGETRYTMSYILNIKPLTPAGKYISNMSVVVSARF